MCYTAWKTSHVIRTGYPTVTLFLIETELQTWSLAEVCVRGPGLYTEHRKMYAYIYCFNKNAQFQIGPVPSWLLFVTVFQQSTRSLSEEKRILMKLCGSERPEIGLGWWRKVNTQRERRAFFITTQDFAGKLFRFSYLEKTRLTSP